MSTTTIMDLMGWLILITILLFTPFLLGIRIPLAFAGMIALRSYLGSVFGPPGNPDP